MASKKTLNAENLEALGAQRLAAVLIDIAEGDPAIKRRLRLEIAAKEAPETVAAEVRKRLSQIARARSYVDWRKVRDLAADLEEQRRLIVDRVATIDAREALELMWAFMELAKPVYERCDDSNGTIGGVFSVACRDLGALADKARPDPIALAERTFKAVIENNYGQYDGLIETLAPALGSRGLDHLKKLFVDLAKTPIDKPPKGERKRIGWATSGPIYDDEIKALGRESMISFALRAIADAQGDVDAFIAQYDEKARKAPKIAADIARRLLVVGRTKEALATIEAAEQGRGSGPDFDVENVRIETLDALGRGSEAQAARWRCFERALSAEHLRTYLKRLPDFDDFEAEERALDHAEQHESLLQGLAFLVSWPALDRAARLVIRRAGELDGDFYWILSPASEALAGKHPLAATLTLRAMIDFTLTKARSSRYNHAARHLLECASLASSIADYGAFETHEAYAARLRAQHGRKSGFWSLIA